MKGNFPKKTCGRVLMIFAFGLLASACAQMTAQVIANPVPFVLGVIGMRHGVAYVVDGTAQPLQQPLLEMDVIPSYLQTVETIAILEITEPPNFSRNPASREGFSFAQAAQTYLEDLLREAGYAVVRHAPVRKHRFRLADDYSGLDVDGVDAYLDLAVIEIGYERQARLPRELRPRVAVAVRMVAVGSGHVIYAGTLNYGWALDSQASGAQLEAPADHRFDSMDDLQADPAGAARHIAHALEAIAQQVAATLDRRKLSADANDGGPPAVATAPLADISGTWRSAITSNSKWQFVRKFQRLEIRIVQRGDRFTGVDERFATRISGTVEPQRIVFHVSAGQASGFYEAAGTWRLNADGKGLSGSWRASGGPDAGGGEWNLTRLD